MQTYFLRSPATGRIKIGRSKNAAQRVRDLSTASADDLELLGVLEGDRELELHAQFAEARARGEWFMLSPALGDFLKATFGCVIREAQPSREFAERFGKPIVETWHQIVNRAEDVFGIGLRRGDHQYYCDAAYSFNSQVRAQRAREDAVRCSPNPDSASEIGGDADEYVSEEMDRLIWSPEDWWPWVLGWAFVDETEATAGAVCLLFKKPGDPHKLEQFARFVAHIAAMADASGIDLRAAVAVRRRTDSNEWLGEFLGPVTLDDEADIWGLETGFLTPIIIDSKFRFQLLGDSWYRGRGLPTPAEENLVP